MYTCLTFTTCIADDDDYETYDGHTLKTYGSFHDMMLDVIQLKLIGDRTRCEIQTINDTFKFDLYDAYDDVQDKCVDGLYVKVDRECLKSPLMNEFLAFGWKQVPGRRATLLMWEYPKED